MVDILPIDGKQYTVFQYIHKFLKLKKKTQSSKCKITNWIQLSQTKINGLHLHILQRCI